MGMIRSLIVAGIALAAMSIAYAIPAVAATPTDPGVYEPIQASIETSLTRQVLEDAVALNHIAPAVTVAAVRSSAKPSSLTVASTPIAVEAYAHIDPHIRC